MTNHTLSFFFFLTRDKQIFRVNTENIDDAMAYYDL